jgi:hypothetical protein
LQSDYGREFVNAVIAEFSMLWPELKLVTERPRHPQSQGAVERLNGVIQDKLVIWMQENNTKRWSVGLKFVQWQINISRHESTGHSPFKVTFGQDLQVGVGSSILPRNALCKIATEEELDTFLAESEKGTATTVMEDVPITAEVGEETATGNEDETGTYAAYGGRERNRFRTDVGVGADAAVMEIVSETPEVDEETQIERFLEIRDTAEKGQSKAADRMVCRGKRFLRALTVGQCNAKQ